MKVVFYTLLAVLTHGMIHAQDYCKRITREVSPDKKSFTYTSPFEPLDPTSVHVTRSINIDPDYPSDNFFIVFKITNPLESIYTKDAEGKQVEKEEKQVIVEFADNTKLVDDTIVVGHDLTDDKLQAIRLVYYPVTEGNAKDFISKKIVKFKLAGFEEAYQGDSAVCVQHYVQCIKEAAK